MQDARNAETWEPPKSSRFRRETAHLTFTETDKPSSALARAAPALLGLLAGAAAGALGWFYFGLFGG